MPTHTPHSDIRTAHCACTALTLHCSGAPERVSLCHCQACQRRTGAPFGIAAFYRDVSIRITGQSARYTRGSDSGYDITFHFCADCGSTVYWFPHRKPGLIAVAVGAFADPAFPAPTQEVFAEYRHSWVNALGS